MFKKPIKIKSNSQTKASERKQFKDLLLKSFPNITEYQANELLPKKEPLNVLKIVTSDNTILQVYTIQKRPVIFDLKGKIFPTIFLLWKFPDLLHSFTTHEQVMRCHLVSGADLMLPGVVTPPQHTGLPKYGSVNENDIVSVNLTINKAPIAVGVASQSSASLMLANEKGKCVNIYHFYGDHLCTLEGMPNSSVPNLGPPHWLQLNDFDRDFPVLGSKREISDHNLNEDQNDLLEEEIKENEQNVDNNVQEDEVKSVEDADELLMYCFLGALKYTKTTLPALTSNFFKLQMLAVCPNNKNLDIKKTSYKKLKPFLEKMSQEGLITVKEIKKGVEAVTAINKNHPMLSRFFIESEKRPKKEANDNETVQKTDVTESYIITQNVLPLFEKEGFHKGDVLQLLEIRKQVTKYVKENNLQDETNQKLVNPKHVLATICKTENSVTWEEVIEKVCEAMRNCYKVKSGNEEITAKGKPSPITISVSTRAGNKKVTLVDNLEVFNIRINDFAKECQHGVAASTSISRPPGKKTDQLLVQGNQVLFVYNLLVDKYKISKKYIRGLENAPKKK